ncbi:pyrimidine 5'-nucleotidase [Jannaschia sp. LMIT008]|uniref:pyrimidine 5'-nucleotidase n=1 Tax=Jannaschia maritima TaxID=3032585 RepID=UPI00281113BC|nr:pyrimidine 5'-nucleotidase [Jannaschia sp. LMIT008]
MHPDFAHVTTWVFDLDETLYPAGSPLFPQIEERMTAWITNFLGVDAREADRLRRGWWERHGTTLAGLMRDHGIDPEPFAEDVHEIDFGVLDPDPALAAALADLPGRRVVYTNGTIPYARNVLAARGLDGLWDAVHGVETADWHPKPDAAAYGRVFRIDGLDPRRAAMFEDTARNLRVPHAMGLRTVHVSAHPDAGSHVDHHAPDLTAFLRDIVGT